MPPRKPTQRDLIYLAFASNPCYFNVTGKRPENVEINLEGGTWTYWGYTQKIGEAKPMLSEHGSSNEVIGVYNRRNISHLASMVSTASESTRRSSRGAIDMG